MRSILTACRARWKRLSPLQRDVTLILLFKGTALGLLWWLFFSAPLAPNMHVAPDRMADRLLAPSLPPASDAHH